MYGIPMMLLNHNDLFPTNKGCVHRTRGHLTLGGGNELANLKRNDMNACCNKYFKLTVSVTNLFTVFLVSVHLGSITWTK